VNYSFQQRAEATSHGHPRPQQLSPQPAATSSKQSNDPDRQQQRGQRRTARHPTAAQPTTASTQRAPATTAQKTQRHDRATSDEQTATAARNGQQPTATGRKTTARPKQATRPTQQQHAQQTPPEQTHNNNGSPQHRHGQPVRCAGYGTRKTADAARERSERLRRRAPLYVLRVAEGSRAIMKAPVASYHNAARTRRDGANDADEAATTARNPRQEAPDAAR